MVDKEPDAYNFPLTDNNSKKFRPNRNIGIILSFVSLLLLGMLPIISNSRPSSLNALNFAFYLSFWELVCSLPLSSYEMTKSDKGIFKKPLDSKIRKKTW